MVTLALAGLTPIRSLSLAAVPVLSCKAKSFSRTDKIMKKFSVSSKSPSDVMFIGTVRDVTPGLNVS